MVFYPITELNDKEALRRFAYEGKKAGFVGMAEDEVKSAMKSALESQGYKVRVKWGNAQGPDIEAKNGSRLLIEVKGEGSYRQMLGNYFLQALGEILQRMTDDQCCYAIALPAHKSYIELVFKLSTKVRQALQLDFYFVKPADTVHEVALLRWHVP